MPSPRLALLLFAAACGPTRAEPPSSTASGCVHPPPNVLLLTIDTLRADHLSCYGYPLATTPRLDAFAAQSVLFENAHSASSWTLPGLASLLTGEDPSTHGCTNFATSLSNAHRTLAERLLAHGYDTAAITTNFFTTEAYGLQQGCVWYEDESFRTEDGEIELGVTSPRVSDAAISYLEHKAAAADGWPWFLWLHYMDPHDSYVFHEGFTERFQGLSDDDPIAPERALYDGEIRFTDHHVGRVLDALERLGLAESTLVVVSSDHGEEFGDHGGRHHGHTLYRELTRVPLLVRAPGYAPHRVPELVASIDVLPTLLELTNAPRTHSLPGRSLVPALRGETLDPKPVLSQVANHADAVLDGVRTDDWTLLKHLGERPRVELFGARDDPGETLDRSAAEPAECERLEPVLAALVALAERRAREFGVAGTRELSAQELEVLRNLGYVGER